MRRYVIVGAGAVGGAVGGLMAAEGREVVLVARGRHREVMAAEGLRLRCPDGTTTVRPPVAGGPADVVLTPADVLVLATKTQQAGEALDQWADAPVGDLGRAGEVLPVLTTTNGVAGEELALRRFDQVYGVCVWFPAVMLEPGEIIVRGALPVRGIFHVGRYGGGSVPDGFLDGVRDDWAAGGLRVVPSDHVLRWKYRKLLGNLGNAVQALLGAAPDAGDVYAAVEAEGREILTAAGIEFPDDAEAGAAWQDWVPGAVPDAPADLGGSSWQSLVRGAGSIETDYLNGEIALVARRIGRTAPLNAGLAALARDAARTGRKPGELSTADLRRALGL